MVMWVGRSPKHCRVFVVASAALEYTGRLSVWGPFWERAHTICGVPCFGHLWVRSLWIPLLASKEDFANKVTVNWKLEREFNVG